MPAFLCLCLHALVPLQEDTQTSATLVTPTGLSSGPHPQTVLCSTRSNWVFVLCLKVNSQLALSPLKLELCFKEVLILKSRDLTLHLSDALETATTHQLLSKPDCFLRLLSRG